MVRRCHAICGATLLIVLVCSDDSASAQLRENVGPGAVTTAKSRDTDADPLQDPAEQRFPDCAALKTDSEQQQLLKQARRSLAEGRPDLATVLWQKLLDDGGNTLVINKTIEPLGPTSTPLMIYRSLTEEVERTLATLPRSALETYRTSADADARALLAAAGAAREEEALNQIVRRFFISSIGDDAAYKLACIALDRHDFAAARRLLAKILTGHPDPSVPKGEILVRLAVAAAHLRDRAVAEQALAEWSTVANPRPAAELVEVITADVRRALSLMAESGSSPSHDWLMALGNPLRTGDMPALPAVATGGALSELWVREFPLLTAAPDGDASDWGSVVADSSGPRNSSRTIKAPRDEIVAQWRAGGWRPTGQLLFAGDRVYLKTPTQLMCYGTAADSEQPIWRSAWENYYGLDGAAQQMRMLAMSMGGTVLSRTPSKPKAPGEVLLFGDRVHQSLAMADGVVYSLEGKRLGHSGAAQPVRPFQWGTTPRRSRSNWLTAYHARGGRALWTRTASDDDPTGAADIGFLAAPTPSGGLLLGPVTEGGTMWLMALDGADGQTVWKTYLCDEPQGGAPLWAEPVMAVEGSEAYLACGCGVIFAVDCADGAIRWAVRYARDGKPNAVLRNLYGSGLNVAHDFSGWDDDVAILCGRMLIVMPSDSDRILALDRRTGERLWEAPRTSPQGRTASYCLGVNGDGLFVAGRNIVRRHDLSTGRLLHETELENSLGRGCLTSDAVYLPVNESIVKLDLDLKRELARVGVVLPADEPVGNLFSDGEKLWVVGAGRVYALTTLEQRLATLGDEIAGGDAEAQLKRMRLRFNQGQFEPAISDLRGAYALLRSQRTPDEAALRLFAAIDLQRLAPSEPLVVLSLLTELFVAPSSRPNLGPEAAARLIDVLATCISGIRQLRPAGSIAAILSAAPLLTEDHLLSAAMFAVDAAATKDDVPRLINALERRSAAAQLIAVRAAARLAPEEAKMTLMKQLSGGDDRVRLAAARALANLGERKDILETLVLLLDSPNVQVRSRSQASLQALTGQPIPFAPEGSPADRAATIQAWQQWVASSGATAKLKLPLADKSALLGRILLAAPGALIELDADYKELWRTRLAGAAWGCQGLANGHRLVAVNSHSMVIEYDEGGREVWKKDRLPAPPTSVERLDNGNTLVTCASARQIVEITPDGSMTTISVPGQPVWAQRLDNGNTLVALQQPEPRVAELTASGRVVWEVRTGTMPPCHAVRLANGNTLVTLTQARKVVEYDPTGKTIVWQSTPASLIGPFAAQRLPNGNTLVADQTGLREIDPAGKQIRWHRQQQVTGLSSF